MFADGAFETVKPAAPIYCHQDFLEKLDSHRDSPIGKRASLLLQRLAIDARRQHYKSTRGENRGWRRSRLGGNHGSHFYAWWAPASAQMLRKAEGFSEAPKGSFVLRDIRHHDDHSVATPQDLNAHYLPVTVQEMRRQEYGPAPWTPPQEKFAGAHGTVRILKGHPGSGKTTALLHAADSVSASRILYVTYSPELANLAREYFDRYCSREKQFHVVTYDAFLRELVPGAAEAVPLAECRQRFERDLSGYARSLGPWTGHANALFDEFHAHLVGSALPVKAGRFQECAGPRVSDRSYGERRARFIGQGSVAAALDVAARLEKMDPRPLAARYFPNLDLAWRTASQLARRILPVSTGFECIAHGIPWV